MEEAGRLYPSARATPRLLPVFTAAEIRRRYDVARRTEFLEKMLDTKDHGQDETRRLQITVRRLGYESEEMDLDERKRALRAVRNAAIVAAPFGPDFLDPVDAGLAAARLCIEKEERESRALELCSLAFATCNLSMKAYFTIAAAAAGDEKAFRIAKFYAWMAKEGPEDMRRQFAFVPECVERLVLHYAETNSKIDKEIEEGRRNSGTTPWQGLT